MNDPFNQVEFNFNTPAQNMDGYHQWYEELEEKQRDFEKKWGIRLGKKVRLSLKTHSRSIEGIITQESDAEPPTLKIRGITFTPHEVESLVTL